MKATTRRCNWQLFLYYLKKHFLFQQTGETPLHAAASGGSPEVVKILLESGCQIEATDQVGTLILLYVVRLK